MKKSTEELFQEIQMCDCAENYLEENKEEMCRISLSAYLQLMLQKYGLKKSALFRRAGQEGSNYGYELFRNDLKSPSRDILIAICLAFPLTIEETQTALRYAGLAALYPRNIRDAYIMFALKNKMTVDALDEILEEQGSQTLL